MHQLQFVENKSLRQQFESTKSTSAVGHMVQLLQKWQSSGTLILLSAKNQTHADSFQQLLDDLGVESTVAGDQLSPKTCPWLEWLENSNADHQSDSVPIFNRKCFFRFQKTWLSRGRHFLFCWLRKKFSVKNTQQKIAAHTSSPDRRKPGWFEGRRSCCSSGLWNWMLSGPAENFRRRQPKRIHEAGLRAGWKSICSCR